jgi:hypothetical protein
MRLNMAIYTAFSRATRFSYVGKFDGFESFRFTKKIPRNEREEMRFFD